MQIFVFSLAAMCAGVLAQDINSLPECERNCVTNVVALGPSFDCPAIDNGQSAPDCLCSREAFAYAIRDCSQESCPEGTDVEQVQRYGLEYCQSAQASVSGTPLAAIGIFSSGAPEASTTGAESSSSSASESSSSREPITTIPIISTITSGSSTEETTLGSTTIFSGETLSPSASANSSETSSGNGTETGAGETGAGAGGTSSSAVTTRPVVSTVTEPSTTRETTVGSSTEFSQATGASSSEGAGATMAPLRIMPAFTARQGNGFSIGAWIMQALGWTVFVVGMVQLM